MDEVILLFLRLGADGKGIENACAECVSNGFRGAIAKISLAQDLHANDALSLGSHLLNYSDNDVRVGIHMRANWVESHEIDIDPRRSGSGSQGLNAVAGDAVGSNDALLLGLGQDVHDTPVTRRPVPFGYTMDEYDVNMIDA